MTLDQFKHACGLSSLSEVDRVCYLGFFYLKTKGIQEFGAAEAARWLIGAGGARPNQSRLDENLRASRSTMRGTLGWRLKDDFIQKLESQHPQLSSKSQEVVDEGTILPEADYEKTRGYIQSLARQINASFEHNLFGGCAVLMRRMVEVLLILSYRQLGIESTIKGSDGNFYMLERIVSDAKTNGTLALSRNSKSCLDSFRELGNFSAHGVEYTCRREYITPHIQEFRALVAELLHRAAIRT